MALRSRRRRCKSPRRMRRSWSRPGCSSAILFSLPQSVFAERLPAILHHKSSQGMVCYYVLQEFGSARCLRKRDLGRRQGVPFDLDRRSLGIGSILDQLGVSSTRRSISANTLSIKALVSTVTASSSSPSFSAAARRRESSPC